MGAIQRAQGRLTITIRDVDEESRQASFEAYGLSGNVNWRNVDPRLERLAVMGQRVLGGDVYCVISFMDGPQLRTISGVRGEPSSVTMRSDALSERLLKGVRSEAVIVVEDASKHPLLADSPWVNGEVASVKFLALAPLIGQEGYVLGAFCIGAERVLQAEPARVRALADLRDATMRVLTERRYEFSRIRRPD